MREHTSDVRKGPLIRVLQVPGLHAVLRGRPLHDQRGWGEVWRAALTLNGAQVDGYKRIHLFEVYITDNAELHVTISQSVESGIDTGAQRWHFTLKQQQGLLGMSLPAAPWEHAPGVG